MAVLGGLVGLGAGAAFVGRAVVVVGGGGVGPFGPGDRPVVTLVRRLERKLLFLGSGLGGGWDAASLGGGVWGGGGGSPPLLPLAHPTPSHASHGPGNCRVDHDLANLQKKIKKKCE